MKRPTRQFPRRFSAGVAASLIALSAAPLSAAPLAAQAPAPTVPAPAPTVPAPAPGVTTAPGTATAPTLTLDQVLARALENNSSVLLAQQQVLKAQQLINEANASGLPQISVNVVDTLSTTKTFGTAGGGTNTAGTLPGGGAIPVIIDTGGGNASGVTSSGGGGTATGAGSTSAGSTTTTTSTATGATTNTTPTNSTLGSGGTTSTGTGGTGTGTIGTGTGTIGTGTGGTGTSTGTTGQARPGAALPPIMRQFASVANPRPSAGQPLKAHDTTTGTGTGTGALPGNGSLNNAISGQNNNYSAQVSVTQGIDIFNLVPAAEDVEKLTRDFYVTDLRRVENETVLSVKDQYFNVLRDQEQVVVYQEQVAADQESVRVTQAQVNAGSVAQFDLLTAQTTLSNAQQQLSSAQDTLTLAQDNLNNLLGINPDAPFALAVPPVPP